MCNIAGYAGNQQAAPLLLEMLRRQQYFDGAMSTGVATIHEGKLYYRKAIGDVDTLIRETDVLDLPGTIGIAHTRPAGGDPEKPFHPFISMDGKTALVTNGNTPRSKYSPMWDEAANFLKENGVKYLHETENPKGESPMLAGTGNYITPAEVRVHLVDYYMKQGETPAEALALTSTKMYGDNVTVFVTENDPDHIHLLRTTRAMTAVMDNGASYIATTRFAYPEDLAAKAFDLPLFHSVAVSQSGITISPYKIDIEPVSELTPAIYRKGYEYLETLLASDEAPVIFDSLEGKLGDLADLWPGGYTYSQKARLAYDLVWQLHTEGRLGWKTVDQVVEDGSRKRYAIWLEK